MSSTADQNLPNAASLIPPAPGPIVGPAAGVLPFNRRAVPGQNAVPAQNNSERIAVIGAGITGITTAYALLQRGARVTVFDRQPYAAMETSFANGGQLSASNAEVWNSWSTVAKGIKWMFTPGAPLLVNPTPTWHKLSWMAEFIAAIPKHEANTITTARLAVEARAHLMRMATDEGIEFDREGRGILHFYASKAEYEIAAQTSDMLKKGGLDRRPVTPAEIKSIEPSLRGQIYGGFYTPSDFTGDIHKFTTGLATACQRLGAEMRFATEISDITATEGGITIVSHNIDALPADVKSENEDRPEDVLSFDKVIVCGGVWSRDLASKLGDRINVYPVKGYSITVNLAEESDQRSAPWVSLLDEKSKIVTSRLGKTRLRVAGTAEFNGFNRDIKAARIEPLISWCRAHFPGMSTRHVVPWAGLRPMMPDMMPRVMQGKNPRVFYNTGHGHLGWTLSAATAESVAIIATVKRNSAGI